MAAAWLLPEEFSDAVEVVIAPIAPHMFRAVVLLRDPNIQALAERRGRIAAGGALVKMERLRRLPLFDAGIGGDNYILLLAARHSHSACAAVYLALTVNRSVPLATLDRKLVTAARKAGVPVLGPFPHGD